MQASGTVDGEVGMSYFCKYLLRSGTWDWDVAVHIKEHHITRTPGIIRRSRPRWNVSFFHLFCPFWVTASSFSPLLLLLSSSPFWMNCMAWSKPIKIALLERVEGERGKGDHNKHWFSCFFLPTGSDANSSPSFKPPLWLLRLLHREHASLWGCDG